VVIHDLDVPCRAFSPLKAYPPLIIDADAVLSATIPVQSFETIARRRTQVIELFRRVDGEKLCSRPALNLVRQSPDHVAGKQRCRTLVSEAFNHECGTYRKTVRLSISFEMR
jgi:hypothetical protein